MMSYAWAIERWDLPVLVGKLQNERHLGDSDMRKSNWTANGSDCSYIRGGRIPCGSSYPGQGRARRRLFEVSRV